VRALSRKLARELVRTRGQGIAIVALVACAVATFVASVSTWRALQRTQDALYETHRFPHVFAELKRAPEALAARIAALPGVAAVETRVMSEVLLDVPGLPDPASALLRSVPDDGEPRLDRLHIREGRSVAPGRADEVVASESFARANRLGPGDRISAVIDGRWKALRVVGIGGSPEQVFTVRAGGILNDDLHYGVLWMSRQALAAALDLTGAFDSVAVRLAPGAGAAPVIEALDRLLAPYGGRGAYGREQQTSHRLVTDEISQMRVMATTVPVVILGVAAFLLSLVLSRLVATQRMQIGTLKALGYGSWAVGRHYAAMALVLVAVGAAVGVAGGYWLGDALSEVYARYYRFPAILYEAEPALALGATVLAAVAALAAVSGAVGRAVRLAPAEAMRPEPPPTFRPSWVERIGLGRLLSPTGRMVLRDLARRPVRASLSAVGIGAAVGCTMVAAFTRDASQVLVEQEFGQVSREDMAVQFTHPLAPGAVRELRSLPGVMGAEPFRAAPATLRSGHRTYRTAVLGLDPGASLHRVVDARRGAMDVPAAGLLLSRELARRLEVGPGDQVRLDFQEGARRSAQVPVSGLVDDLVGVQAVMDRAALDRLAGDGSLVSGAYLAVDPGSTGELNRHLLRMPRVAGVALAEATRRSVERMLDDSLLWFTALLTFFAVLIAVGVVYNGARLALAERERELATLRVVGFTRGEVWRIAVGELWVQVAAGVPLGWLVGWGFVELTAAATASELMRLPAVVTPANAARATGVVVIAAVLVALWSRRWLARLDLVSVLKAKE
jgi:putative ABC transport system permease protein